MGKRLINKKQKTVLAIAPVAIIIIFCVTVSAVSAAIPDQSGVINACYKNSTKDLRVTDSSVNCNTNETALNWSQQGPEAYGYVVFDQDTFTNSLDFSLSKNIIAFAENPGIAICVQVSFEPKNINYPGSGTAIKVGGIWKEGLNGAGGGV